MVLKSKGEETLALQLKVERINFEREVRFCPSRQWRADFIIPPGNLLIEIHGGIWNRGAHVRGKQFESDCEKHNEAVISGWRVLQFTTDQVMSGEAINTIKRAIQ